MNTHKHFQESHLDSDDYYDELKNDEEDPIELENLESFKEYLLENDLEDMIM